MGSALPRVISLPRKGPSDDQKDFLLVHVASTGASPLDLKLIGTDETDVFSVSLTQTGASRLNSKRASANSEEWEKILTFILLGGEHNEATQGIEAIAEVEGEGEGSELKIRIRKQIEGGITQNLGEITLSYTEDELLSLFDWVSLTIKTRDKVNLELETIRAQLKAKEDETKKLNETLAELVKLKNDHERGLIEKFSLLLNEKKLKIRDQQRLLACSNVDPAKLAAIEQARTETKARSAGPSRAGKRKGVIKDESDEDSDEGFEKMDVDAPQPANDSEEDPLQTPDQSTVDDDSEDEAPPVPAPTRKAANKAKPATKKTRAATEDSEDEAPSVPSTRRATNQATSAAMKTRGKSSEPPSPASESPKALPPKRELPFGRRPAERPAERRKSSPRLPPVALAHDGSETESDDDEL